MQQNFRNGLLQYDQRRGYRGPLTNKKYTKDWHKDLEKFKLEKTIDWDLAIIKKVNKYNVEIETQKKMMGLLNIVMLHGPKKKSLNF